MNNSPRVEGAVLEKSPIGTHQHQCPECGTIWEHPTECAGNTEAHRCPMAGCNGVQFSHYLGKEAAHFAQACGGPEEVVAWARPAFLTAIKAHQQTAKTQ